MGSELGGTKMSANFHTYSIENNQSGAVWQQLHAEREVICDSLLKEYPTRSEDKKLADNDLRQTAIWHRNLLQARLSNIDDALDRLMSGSYGNCCKCGRWIEDTKLQFDPAVAYCYECWERLQTAH
jgi:RNA polymerase-binding transcription factor DksA